MSWVKLTHLEMVRIAGYAFVMIPVCHVECARDSSQTRNGNIRLPRGMDVTELDDYPFYTISIEHSV